ncbi:MAG: flagellar hook protein FlgE [Sphingomonas sp.]
MSLYSALYAGVSGLSAQASAMATVADNITNVNTVGYKQTESDFSTLVTDGRAGADYAAGGVKAVPTTMVSQQGLLQSSSSSTDLAIDGNGFFVTRTSADASGQLAFTRAGSFSPDSQGYLHNSSGLYLYGWPLDAQGNYTNTGNFAALQPVRVSGLTGTATPTTQISMRANLDATTPTYSGTYTAGDMASGAATPDFTRSFDVYDSQGVSHRLTMSFLKTGDNQWSQEVFAVPASDVTAPNGLLTSGTLKFNTDGSLNAAGSTPALFSPLTVNWTNNAASAPITLGLGTNGGIDGITQYGTQSAMMSSSVDGGVLGNLSSIEVTKSGQVNAVFDDGSTRAVFQLPVATLTNPDGMTRLSGNAYAPSHDSGSATLTTPGTLGAGTLASHSLEASTVDLAGEFSNMIRFQRAYSASSKIITTVDEMLQEVSNLKR